MSELELICERIKKHRKERGITLKELAAKTNLSVSYLSKIEHDASGLSIGALSKICSVLGVECSDIFTQTLPQTEVVIKKRAEQEILRYRESSMSYIMLSARGLPMKSMLITLRPALKYPRDFIRHTTDEIGYVIEGQMVVQTEDRDGIRHKYVLSKGDSIYIFAGVAHTLRCHGEEKCVSIWNFQTSTSMPFNSFDH